MEVDTGAAVSIISKAQQQELLPQIHINPSPICLKAYMGEQMDVIGEAVVNVTYKQQCASLPLVVVAEEGPPLIG